MKIVADDKIPLLKELFPAPFELILLPGAKINATHVRQADILLVRTVTHVNQALLENSSIRFVGSATAGFDHLDTAWLTANNITWAYAPGVNANAVGEYVLCCIAALRTKNLLTNERLRVGVIGAGFAGQNVIHKFQALGFEVLISDPPRALREPDFISTPLSEFHDLDLICLHPSLTKTGAYPSFHLIDDDFLQRQKKGTVILNASRGEIIDENALLRASHLHLCLDVWENEPDINLQLLEKAIIATPHIAGYSLPAKYQASIQLYQQMQRYFSLPDAVIARSEATRQSNFNLQKSTALDCHTPADASARNDILTADWEKIALATYNPLPHSDLMRSALLSKTKIFEQLRREYPLRPEFTIPVNKS